MDERDYIAMNKENPPLDKVYVINCSKGSYDDYYVWIGGIFTDKKIAEDTCKKLNDEQAANLLIPNPVSDEDFHEGMDEKTLNLYCEWDKINSLAGDWNNATVSEIELNKII